jgi:hypothetical protein
MSSADPLITVLDGCVLDTADTQWGSGTAVFSHDRTHRYRLSRVWDASLPRVNFLMLNPSTADAFQLDPTVRRCMGFGREWGCGQVEITNIFALRSTDPSALYHHDDPVGSLNDDAIVQAASAASIVVAAWGTHGALQERDTAVRRLLAEHGVALHALKLTRHGHPAHPLYLPAASQPTPFDHTS